MIKAKKGTVKIEGGTNCILSEYATITKALVECFVQNGTPEDEAVKDVTKAHSVGLVTDEQIRKEAKELAARLLKDVASDLVKEEENE